MLRGLSVLLMLWSGCNLSLRNSPCQPELRLPTRYGCIPEAYEIRLQNLRVKTFELFHLNPADPIVFQYTLSLEHRMRSAGK
jgi:hypothetical protein